MAHLLNNNLVKPTQHGFMKGLSCTSNLIEFFNSVTRSLDIRDPVDVVFLDFAKAFDLVPKRRLMEKLRANGIGGKIWTWIQNWLTGRKQSGY